MKAQSSMEMLFSLATFIALLLPVLFLALTMAQLNEEKLSKAQARAALNILEDTANRVYLGGNTAMEEVTLMLPYSVNDFTIEGKEIKAKLSTGDEIVTYTMPNLIYASEGKAISGTVTLCLRNKDGDVEVTPGRCG
ncbi:MAG: hypothetical protein QW035_04215 [Candidatus Anstonellales archaeon]